MTDPDGPPSMPDPPCGAEADWQALGLSGPQPPCIKAPGHEYGPETDWKRDLHGNGFLRWPVSTDGAVRVDGDEGDLYLMAYLVAGADPGGLAAVRRVDVRFRSPSLLSWEDVESFDEVLTAHLRDRALIGPRQSAQVLSWTRIADPS